MTAADALEAAGRQEEAALLRDEVIGRNVLDGQTLSATAHRRVVGDGRTRSHYIRPDMHVRSLRTALVAGSPEDLAS